MGRSATSVAISAVLFALGCGHAAPTGEVPAKPHPTPPDAAIAAAPDAARGLEDDLPALAERSVAMYVSLAHVLQMPDHDCTAAALGVDAIASAYADTIAAVGKILRAHDHARVDQLKHELELRHEPYDAAAQTIATSATMKKCSSDPAFAKAFERLESDP